MKNFKHCLIGLCGMVVFSGCVSFHNTPVMPGDSDVDEKNMPNVARDIKINEERTRFKRPVSVKLSEKAARFLSKRYYRGSGKIFLSPELRKDLLATADSKLVNVVKGMSDFELVDSESTLRSGPGATITRVPAQGASTANAPYLMTFNINNVEVLDAGDTIREVSNIATSVLRVAGAHGAAHNVSRGASQIHWFMAAVDLEITLTAPNGKTVFNFAKSVTCPDTFPSNRPNETALKRAVAYAVEEAMKQYAAQFAPPLYVDQTKGNGLFVRLSAGSNYGIAAGQKVNFFRTVRRRVPSVNGEQYGFQKVIIRTGEVGAKGAPVEKDHAWVYVDGNDEVRSVFTWTSAEIAR